LLSPGKFSPVGSPKPKSCRYFTNCGIRICCAAMIVPTFDDFAITPAMVRLRVPCDQWSLIVRRCTSVLPGTRSLVFRSIRPASARAAIVTTFCTLPGS
jgi:hypothetical protein